MKAKTILIGLCILIVLIGANYRFSLRNYGEECYIYDTYNEDYCLGYWSYTAYNVTNGNVEVINLTNPICKCGYYYYTNGCLRTRSVINESRCLKYHLVRGVQINTKLRR